MRGYPGLTFFRQARTAPVPLHGVVGLVLIAVSWPASWLHAGSLGENAFFPLWLGYILTVDALVLRRKGNSLFTRGPWAFWGMFLLAAPLWWAFEGINHFTQNWHFLGAEEYSTLRYVVVATWHFTIVIPAVFETAELIGSFGFMRRLGRGPALPASRWFLAATVLAGLITFGSLILWPRYAFPFTWACFILVLDPVNYLRGRPSIGARLRDGDWRLVLALGLGPLVCGWFWEMWNYWAHLKWEYTIPFVDFARVFEMPVLGYGGYLPFGLETYAVYHFVTALVGRPDGGYVQIIPPEVEGSHQGSPV
ncbi:MAG: hypothetical protein QF659_07110 [Dehalococcoidia bacterium]|nr:hypothetical protein [Dehalococcoidia bacterium]